MRIYESEAREKFCPHINGLCKGEDCMMWETIGIQHIIDKNERVGRPVTISDHSLAAEPTVFAIDRATGKIGTDNWDGVEMIGYCGLVGKAP